MNVFPGVPTVSVSVLQDETGPSDTSQKQHGIQMNTIQMTAEKCRVSDLFHMRFPTARRDISHRILNDSPNRKWRIETNRDFTQLFFVL